MNTPVVVNGLRFTPSSATSFTFVGEKTGRTLAGITLEFVSRGERGIQTVQALLENESVEVIDPYVARTYLATIQQQQMSYTEGENTRSYICEVREIDAAPTIEALEINGTTYTVLAYDIILYSEGVRLHSAVLSVTLDEFDGLYQLTSGDEVMIKRIGVDEDSRLRYIGGGRYWSRHDEAGSSVYKTVFRWKEEEESTSPLRGMASGIFQENIIELLFATVVRLNKVVAILAEKNLLNDEIIQAATAENWREHVPENEIKAMYRSLYKVDDAVEEL